MSLLDFSPRIPLGTFSILLTRKELLAVVSAVKQYHHYLYGCNFLVRSDHGALRWLMNFKQPGGQLASRLETLSMYDFNIEHRQGRVHSNVDGLSRRPCYSHDCKHCENSENKFCEIPKNDKVSCALLNGRSPLGGTHSSDECEWPSHSLIGSLGSGVVESNQCGMLNTKELMHCHCGTNNRAPW